MRVRPGERTTKLSIVVPILDEAAALPPLLAHLAPLQRQACEVILVDGGSTDGSAALARDSGFTVLDAPGGRARQMNAGADLAAGHILLFLHADTRLPPGALQEIDRAMSPPKQEWGRFDVRIEGSSRWLPVIAALMNLRSRLTGIATGDQAIFVRRDVFQQAGGYTEQPLVEDIALSRQIKGRARPVCLRECVTTSGRRWESRGVWRTILLMWTLRLRYWLGASPEALARDYR
ncbi:MAG: TIGR04283 family arsenosugar biosynthesis glycosyltransferase [Gammaproteobacteria bacterium]|nr:TIGR04283 family arsenosugar biosynthesis glycosyltransferase [Gammaproteobacteria bacterium]